MLQTTRTSVFPSMMWVCSIRPESLFFPHVQKGDAPERIRINGSRPKRGQDDGVIGTDAGVLLSILWE